MAKPKVTCIEDGCEDIGTRRKMCGKHYKRFVKYGGLERHPTPTPAQRFWSKVAKGEGCWEWTGTKNPTEYGVIFVEGKNVYAHRFSYYLAHGEIPEGMHIDHSCFNKSCVNPEHLRVATHKQNLEYRRGAYSMSASGIRGVKKRGNRWHAGVVHYGKYHHVGTFATAEEADIAVKAKRAELFTFPEYNQEEAA